MSRHETCPVHRKGSEAIWPTAVASFLNRRIEAATESPLATLRILTPARDSVYRQMPSHETLCQQLAFEAATDRAGETLHWFVDDRPVGQSRSGQSLFWPLERGSHQIVCASARGLSDRVHIAVE